jgi:hypothetical protein
MMDTERLAKLLLMLSSERDGEVVSAARAIGRSLRGAGTDWHGFAARLSGHSHNRSTSNWQAMQRYCLRHPALLRSRELQFVTGLNDWRGELTEKQFAWLSAIYSRLRRQP